MIDFDVLFCKTLKIRPKIATFAIFRKILQLQESLDNKLDTHVGKEKDFIYR
jgi:hypothetical protein